MDPCIIDFFTLFSAMQTHSWNMDKQYKICKHCNFPFKNNFPIVCRILQGYVTIENKCHKRLKFYEFPLLCWRRTYLFFLGKRFIISFKEFLVWSHAKFIQILNVSAINLSVRKYLLIWWFVCFSPLKLKVRERCLVALEIS